MQILKQREAFVNPRRCNAFETIEGSESFVYQGRHSNNEFSAFLLCICFRYNIPR